MRAALAAVPLLFLLAVPAARAGEELLASERVDVRRVAGPLVSDPAAPFWAGIPAREFPLAPQRTLRLHDRAANAPSAGAGSVAVRGVTDGKALAILLEWADATEDRVRQDDTDRYGDAAALQLPLRFGAGRRLPYVGMGDEQEKVLLYLARAAEGGTILRAAVAAGYGSSTRAEPTGASATLRYDAVRKVWQAAFVRPLALPGSELSGALVPIAFAVWDGARHERGGNKALSGWKLLRFPGQAVDPAWVAELEAGRRPEERGDLARGKLLVEGMCAACHHVGERRVARAGLAPELSAIGVQSTPAYLRESIVKPSAVIVPSPNPAQHQDRAKPRDARGALPAAEPFIWARRDAAGKAVSKMPAYGALPAADVSAMVTYLATLGAPIADAGRTP